MISHHLAGMANDDAASENHDLHRLSDQAPKNRVAVGVEVNGTVGAHLTDQVAQLAERSTAAERAQGVSDAPAPLGAADAKRRVSAL